MPINAPPQQSFPIGPGLSFVRLRLADHDVVYLRALLEAYDHLGFVYGEGDGTVHIATTNAQTKALRDFLEGLAKELPLLVELPQGNTHPYTL